jgi:hypothetical protein
VQPEEENHTSITSAVRFELLLRRPSVYVFIQQMEDNQRVIIPFLCKEGVSPENIHAPLEEQFGDATYSERSARR